MHRAADFWIFAFWISFAQKLMFLCCLSVLFFHSDTGDETGLTAEVYFRQVSVNSCLHVQNYSGNFHGLLEWGGIFISFQVMRETSTVIHWPSKLKIGAKSKKGFSIVYFHLLQLLLFKILNDETWDTCGVVGYFFNACAFQLFKLNLCKESPKAGYIATSSWSLYSFLGSVCFETNLKANCVDFLVNVPKFD